MHWESICGKTIQFLKSIRIVHFCLVCHSVCMKSSMENPFCNPDLAGSSLVLLFSLPTSQWTDEENGWKLEFESLPNCLTPFKWPQLAYTHFSSLTHLQMIKTNHLFERISYLILPRNKLAQGCLPSHLHFATGFWTWIKLSSRSLTWSA